MTLSPLFQDFPAGDLCQMNIDDNTRLVFHIGDPKTGTTSIQRALHHRLVECEARSILPWYNWNAVAVANGLKLRNNGFRQAPFSDLRGWLNSSDADLAVISSEFFAMIRPALLQQALNEHLPEHARTAEVIAYVRPHASRFLAAFVQRTKTGLYLGNFDEFLAETKKVDMLRYSVRFGRWRKIFGSRFTLRPFIRSELRDNDIVTDFFTEILNGAPFEIRNTVEENVSVTVRALVGLRHIHKRLGEIGGFEEQTHHLVGETLANRFLPMEALSGEKPRLDRRTAERLTEAYSEDAKTLDREFFGRPLMQEALESCTENTSDKAFELAASQHFHPDEIESLEKLGIEVAKFIAKRRPLFGTYQSMLNGNLRPNQKQLRRIERSRVRLEETDSKMMELAQVLRG